jgi:hypothetical protein
MVDLAHRLASTVAAEVPAGDYYIVESLIEAFHEIGLPQAALVLAYRAWDSGLESGVDFVTTELATQNKATSLEIDRLRRFGRHPDGRPSLAW